MKKGTRKKGGSIKKPISSVKFNLIETEEQKLLKQFEKMESALKKIVINPTNKVQQIKNVSPNGHIENVLIKSVPEKKVRKIFNGCTVQSKITMYENMDPSLDKDEYYEIKKIYRQCPKKN
jgi:hypothetical protein